MSAKRRYHVGQIVVTRTLERQPVRIAEWREHRAYETRFEYRGWYTDTWFTEETLRPLTKNEAGR